MMLKPEYVSFQRWLAIDNCRTIDNAYQSVVQLHDKKESNNYIVPSSTILQATEHGAQTDQELILGLYGLK